LAEPGRERVDPHHHRDFDRRRPRPAAKPPQHLRVVEQAEFGDVRRRRLVRLGGVVVAGLVVAVLFVSVGMHVMLAQNQFQLDRLNAQAEAQQAQYQKLRLDVDRLAAPQRIIAAAQGRLGMVQPGSVTFLAPASATVPGTAGATAAGSVPSGKPSTIAPAGVDPGWLVLKPQLAAHP